MHLDNQSTFYSGTSGLVLPVPNKSFFPIEFQNKSRLAYYASLFNSIEINSSFYKVPLAKTIVKWTEGLSASFRFTFKLWQGITHNKGLVFNAADVIHFLQVIQPTAEKSGCLLIQLPPSATVLNIHQLEKLLNVVQQYNSKNQWKVAVEFRHKSWYQEKVYTLLEKYTATIVLHDMPASSILLFELKSDVVYLRFHGVKGDYKGGYTDDYLAEYAEYINEWQKEGKTVYVYFNNTIGDAIKNLITLNEYVNGL